MALPVAAGLLGAVLPAVGYFPALGGTALSLDPWRDLFAWPGIGAAVRLSLVTGVGATLLSLAATLLIVAAWQGTRSFRVITSLLAPLLSLPHAAAAFGLAFLIAPSGWIARALSPWATGWDRPPDLLIVNDQAGLALIAGLDAEGSALPDADDAGRAWPDRQRAAHGSGAQLGLWPRDRMGQDRLARGLCATAPAGLCRAGLFHVGGRCCPYPWADPPGARLPCRCWTG